jgi:outer membrane biosynthesis protein TonB
MTPNDASGRSSPHHLPPVAGRTGSRFRLVLVAVLALAILALGRQVVTSGLAIAQDPGGTPDGSPVATPAPDAPRVVLEFTELNDSGVEGTATLSEAGDQTIVELELEGTGENHPAHIHEGTCEDIVPQSAYDLENVGEEGTSRTLVDAPLQDLIDGDYVVDLHMSPNELGTLIACADIEGTPEVPGVGGATEGAATEAPTESATEAPTQEPTEAPTAAPTAEPTQEPTEEPTAEPSPTPEPTEAPSPTPEPTEEPTGEPTLEPTEAPTGGTGGVGDATTPVTTPAGDGTDGGKGLPLGGASQVVETSGKGTALSAAGGGDGTQGGGNDSGKGVPLAPTTSTLTGTGSGSSLSTPEGPLGAVMWATGGFAMILLATAATVRRGELRPAGSRRWKRLGL